MRPKSDDAQAKATLSAAAKLVTLLVEMHAKEHDILRDLQQLLGGKRTSQEVVKDLMDSYSELFAEKTGSPYRFVATREVPLLRSLLKTFSPDEIRRRMSAYFNDREDDYARKAKYPFALFVSQFNRFVIDTGEPLELEAEGPEFDCRHTPRCKDAAAHTLRRIQDNLRADPDAV